MAVAKKQIKRTARQNRIRAKVSGTVERPRLSIFKSNRFIYAQIIDDTSGKTLAASSGKEVNGKNKSDQAKAVGLDIAKKAAEKKIKKVVFDRGGYIYTGRVRTVADSAREGGLEF